METTRTLQTTNKNSMVEAVLLKNKLTGPIVTFLEKVEKKKSFLLQLKLSFMFLPGYLGTANSVVTFLFSCTHNPVESLIKSFHLCICTHETAQILKCF